MLERSTLVSHVLSLKHHLDFHYRNCVRIRWKIRDLTNQSKENLYNDSDVSQREYLYRQRYSLDSLFNRSTTTNYKINLYLLNLLECFLSEYMPVFTEKSIKVLDAGSDDWHYVASLWSFLRFWSQKRGFSFHLKGMELDAYRMYPNLHTRLDYAQAYMRGLENTRYEHGNVFDIVEKYELIFSFLPFVTKREAVGWKLPLRFYDPTRYLGHLYRCLRQHGLLLIVNVNRYESSVTREILRKIRVEPVILPERFTSPFFSYRADRYVTLVRKV